MAIEEYPIYPVSEDRVPELLEEHLSRETSYREFRTTDIIPVATFAVHYFLDATQKLFSEAMLGNPAGGDVDITLESGWRVKTLDLGLVWRRHLEFTSPDSETTGFVLAGDLDMVETRDDTGSGSREDFLKRIMSGFKVRDGLVAANESSKQYDPVNSTRLTEIQAFAFSSDGGWSAEPKAEVLDRLGKNQFVSEVFEYRPHRADDQPFPLTTTGRTITEPGDAISVLRVISEFAYAYDPDRFPGYMHRHESAVYTTLQEELVTLWSAARGTFKHGAVFPVEPFPSLIAEMWKRGACADVIANLRFIEESADALIEMGHVSHEEQFDCNDGRTRTYATTDGDTRTVFVEWEEWSTAITLRNDRVHVAKCDFETGRIGDTVIDFTQEDGVLTGIAEVSPYDDMTCGVMRRALVDLSSVHCYVVSDREELLGSPPAPSA